MNGELVVADGFTSTPVQSKQAIQQLKDFIREVMTPGVDYGVIDGTNKPTLYKAGAEKLNELYGYAPCVEITDRTIDWHASPPLIAYEVKVRLVNKRTGQVIAEGIGSCNSMESKYRYRMEYWNGSGIPPTEEGWTDRHSKSGKSYWVRKIINEDTADLANTILKMAKKRALVDATLSATRSSDLFNELYDDTPEDTPGTPPSVDSAGKHQSAAGYPPKRNGGDQQPATEKQLAMIDHLMKTRGIDDPDRFIAQCGCPSRDKLTKQSASKVIEALGSVHVQNDASIGELE